ncbi:hypothetical protein Pcinc_033645 [Petrolisthes cinctipes]|uniref:Uncharacterized protein n=1 Tax=Petrolisthes cinctipes TaxID=88211 RepID=A0AAE1ERW0_PETCI|nr:hypothetical protein Pcinc_033645 [Petrolisthes cinctipes]
MNREKNWKKKPKNKAKNKKKKENMIVKREKDKRDREKRSKVTRRRREKHQPTLSKLLFGDGREAEGQIREGWTDGVAERNNRMGRRGRWGAMGPKEEGWRIGGRKG